METPDIVEHFFGVYLLYCENPKYKGRVYIGYTVDPVRRLKNHNAGKKFGGAWKTSNKGPWNMVLIVHGFPNSTSALRFEWAWQHPQLSRRLRHIPKKKSREKTFEYTLNVLSAMLQVGPWCRLPLTLRWLDDTFADAHSSRVTPPKHMPVIHGKVMSRKPQGNANGKNGEVTEDSEISICDICYMTLDITDKVTCVRADCDLIAHIICLAKEFDHERILPVSGTCPACKGHLLWGDVIRKKIGCHIHLNENQDSTDDSD
ncbi:structure-specific endonuclease subunit slx1 [Fopius arisanus]|uniref:Structure-specific endonuclease subunit SLX1 homolog n=1 Tax=Fopius arisanus TaxID=64838 RepID=A0A9R1SVM7_9HYME|nr:PREDICTED: structure-specific endonuclease subunit slx1 [Fopius arisanus]